MRCLLDKVTARHIMEGMLRLVEGRTVTPAELFALYFYRRARPRGIELFITPQTERLLKRLEHLPRYAGLIRRFLGTTKVSLPARYFKRWARRLREYGFTSEDADVLALATFGTTQDVDVLGMHVVATFDQPMINQWDAQQAEIQQQLTNMRRNLRGPYRHVSLPTVERPERIA
jgi:hypothetical protein